jgi:hypothetical protein
MAHGHFRGGFPKHRIDQSRAAKAQALKSSENLGRKPPAAAPAAHPRGQAALHDIKLLYADSTSPMPPAAAYSELAEAILRVASSGVSESVLCWPAPNISLAASNALAVVASWSDCDPLPTGAGFAQPRELRALYFPWSPRTRLPLASVYVSKDQIHDTHVKHLQRYEAVSTRSGGLWDLHVSLIRVRDLDGRARDGSSHVELLHPALYELVPTSLCGAHGNEQVTALLDRVRAKTQLKELSPSRLADNPETAPYCLFGAQAKAAIDVGVARIPARLSVILLDLTKSGRARFNDEWQYPIARFISLLRSKSPSVPILAVTDDPWVHRELIWKQLKKVVNPSDKRPSPESAVFVADHLVARQQAPPPLYSGCANIIARGFAGKLDALLNRIGQLKSRAAKIEDAPAEALLTNLAALLRRCANLSSGINDLGSYVVKEAGDDAAIHIMAAYQAPKLLAEIERLEGPLAQSRRGPLNDLCRDARELWMSQREETPMAMLLADTLGSYLRNSSRTVVLFRKQMLSDHAADALVGHPDIGDSVRNRLNNGMLRFVDSIGFREASSLPPRERHQTSTAILVSPTRNQALALMTEPWLPNDIIILSDARTLAAIARDAAQLAAMPAFSVFSGRLRTLQSAARAEAQAVSGIKIDFSPQIAPPVDAEFPTTTVIDLTGTPRSQDEILVRIDTEDSQTILARKRTRLVCFDDSSAVPVYRPVTAGEADVGDAICVITDDFVDMARTRLDITHAACEEMRNYHFLVRELYSKIPGDSDRSKRRHVAQLMNQLASDDRGQVTPENVGYWVDLESQFALPLEEVTPHAPRHWETFERFMTALGLPRVVAERYWHWAVIHTRSNRLSAALRLHDAYMGILIAPHAAEAENPKRLTDIRALRTAAEGFVSRIRSKSNIERASLCA